MISGHITDVLQSLKWLPSGLAAPFFSSVTRITLFDSENRIPNLFNNSKIVITFKLSVTQCHNSLYSKSTMNLQGLSTSMSSLQSSPFLYSLMFLHVTPKAKTPYLHKFSQMQT